MLRLIWRPKARQDLATIISYIALRRPAAAQRLGDAIRYAADRLPAHPHMHRPGRAPGTREAVVHPNYILIYRVTPEAVEILTLVHARQRYP